MKKLLAVLAFGFCSLAVQGQNIENQIIASQYGTWQVAGYAPNTYTFQSPSLCMVQGGASHFPAFKVGTPLRIVDGNPSLSETVVPSAVVIDNVTCALSIAPVNDHQLPWHIGSATGGLQEALNNNLSDPATNMVILDNAFYQSVGSANVVAVIAAAKGGTSLNLVDVTTSPYNWYAWNGTQYILVPVGGSAGGNISGNLTPGRLVLGLGPQTIGSSIATDNGTILSYPGTGGIAATNSFTFGVPSSGNYGRLSLTDAFGPNANLQLFSTTAGGTTIDATGVYSQNVEGVYVQTGNLLASGTVTLGTIQNGNPGQSIVINQNGGNPTTLQVNGGLTTTSFTCTGSPCPGSGGGAVSSVFGRTGAVTANGGDYSVSQVTGAAPLASPALTGTPTAPTQACGSGTAIATLTYVANCGGSGGGTPITSLGQIISGNMAGVAVAIAGNTAAAIGFLSETGTGTQAATPVWQPGNGTGNVVQTVSPRMVTPDIGDATGSSVELTGLYTGLHGRGAAMFTDGAAGQVGASGSYSSPGCAAGVACDSLGGEVLFTTGAGTLTAGTIFTVTVPNQRHHVPSCGSSITGGTVALGPFTKASNTSDIITLTMTTIVPLSANTPYDFIWGPCNGN